MDPVLTILLSVIAALMGWVGFSITSVLKGWMIPKATHELQIKLLTDQLGNSREETREWRSATDVERLGKQEAMAQLRMALETNQSYARDFHDFRSGVERAREANDER